MANDNITRNAGLATCTIFAASAISIFFNAKETLGSTYFNIILIGIYLGCLVYTLSTKRITLSNQEILLFLFLTMTLFLNPNNNKVMAFSGLISLSFALHKDKFTLPKWFIDILHSSIFVYLLYDLIYGERVSQLYYILPGTYDPNFTAYIFLLYLIFSLKIKSILGTLLGIIGGILTYSRAFTYSFILIIVFLVFQNLVFKSNFSSRYLILAKKLVNQTILFKGKFIFVSIVLILNCLFFVYGGLIVNNFYTDRAISRSDINRIFNISKSDIIRFEANDYSINYFSNNPHTFFLGDQLLYGDFGKASGMKIPHNGLISSIASRGSLFTFFSLVIVSSLLNRFDAVKSIVFWLPPFFFSIFLHSGFGINQIALIVIITGMDENFIRKSWFSIPFLSFILSLFPRKSKDIKSLQQSMLIYRK